MATMKKATIAWIVLGFVFFLMIVRMATSSGGSTSVPAEVRREVGEHATLKENTAIGKEKQDWDEAHDAAKAKDQYGLMELIASDRVHVLDAGTEVLILDQSPLMTKVRALTGESAGFAGWIAYENVLK